MTNPIQTASVTIPAKAGLVPGTITASMAGQMFACVSATAPFRMCFDSGGLFDCIQGAVIPVGSFKSLSFENNSGQPIIVQFAVGVQGINFIPTNTFKAAPTYTKGTNLAGGTALASGATATFSGSDNNGFNLRKQITVHNRDAGGNAVEVQDANGIALTVLDALTPPWTLETSGVIIVKNTSGQAVSRVIVGETFYS